MLKLDGLFRNLLLWGLLALIACDSPVDEPVDLQILARVGNAEITAEKLYKALKVLYLPGTPRPDEVERKVLQRLIDLELLILKAKRLEHDWQVKKRVQQKEQELLLDELYRRNIIMTISKEVSREEVQDYFKRYRIGEERRLSRILVSSPTAVEQILRRLNAGEDFAALASEVSEDGETAVKAGDLGWRDRLYFRSHLLRRQVFNAAIGEVIGPLEEPDGYSLLMVTDIREVPFEEKAEVVKKAVLEQQKGLATVRYLEDLAERTALKENTEVMQLLLTRLSEAGQQMPKLEEEEEREVLFTMGGTQWTLNQFMAAVLSERDQAEIRSIEDLRNYARRLFALKILLPQRADELGIRETENVQKGMERTLREALVDRLRQVEVDEKIDPSEKEIRQYYQQHRNRYVRSERISILEVLVNTREQAEALLKKLDQGADLADLAKHYSMRSPRIRRAGGRILLLRPDKYGKMGWEAQDAEVGDIVGPVKSIQGYSVFRVLKKIPPYQQSYEEARPRVASHLRQELSRQGFEDLLKRLNRQYRKRIKIYEDHFQAYLRGLPISLSRPISGQYASIGRLVHADS